MKGKNKKALEDFRPISEEYENLFCKNINIDAKYDTFLKQKHYINFDFF